MARQATGTEAKVLTAAHLPAPASSRIECGNGRSPVDPRSRVCRAVRLANGPHHQPGGTMGEVDASRVFRAARAVRRQLWASVLDRGTKWHQFKPRVYATIKPYIDVALPSDLVGNQPPNTCGLGDPHCVRRRRYLPRRGAEDTEPKWRLLGKSGLGTISCRLGGPDFKHPATFRGTQSGATAGNLK